MSAPASKTSFRPRASLLAFIGVAAFAIAGLAKAPASLLAPALTGAGENFQYQEISGTLWRGEVRGASAAGIYLGDIRFRTRALSLMTGALDTRLEMRGGAALGRGAVRYGLLTRRAALKDVKAEFNLGAVRAYTLFGIPYRGVVRASVDQLVWAPQGCVKAAGEVWTDALDDASKQYFGAGLVLTGPAMCDGDRLALDLGGANKEGKATVSIRVAPDFTYQLTANAQPSRQELQENLRLLGFEDNDGAFVYDAIGALKGAGS